jgi:hypothetical protein
MLMTFVLWALAAADDGPPQEIREARMETVFGFGVSARASGIAGVVEERLSSFDDGLDYADLFGGGAGLLFEVEALRRYGPDEWVGGYVSLGFMHYDGEAAESGGGDRIVPEGMDVGSVTAGLRGRYEIGEGFDWEGHAGLGLVFYEQVRATFVTGGVASPDRELFRASTRAAAELGTRFGYGDRFTRVFAGLGLRFQGGPARGAGAASTVDPEVMGELYLEFGATFSF